MATTCAFKDKPYLWASTLTLVLLNGLVYGLLLFMLSSGLTLIFGMMGVLNLAHASFYMLGAYFAYTISLYVGFWPGLVVAPVLVGVLGAVVERYGLRAVHRHGHMAELLFTFGLAFVIGEIVPLIWGRNPVPYRCRRRWTSRCSMSAAPPIRRIACS